jgi:hypothetical protein
MAPADFEYKVLPLTDHLDNPDGADLALEIQAKLGWEVQQIFSRRTGDAEQVFGLLRRGRKKD